MTLQSDIRSRDRSDVGLVQLSIPIPGPYAVLGAARRTVRWSLDTVTLIAALPARLNTLLTELEALMRRVSAVVDEAARTTADAGRVVAGVDDTSERARALLADIEPISAKAVPLGRKFVDNFSEEELAAAIRMVDHLPELLDRMEGLMPILETMDTIAPEIHQLLEVTTDVRKAVVGIPGFKFFRSRGEDKDPEPPRRR